jgi:hypothetical protein
MRIALKALFACVLILLPVGLVQAANTFQTTSLASNVAAGVSTSITSGDVVLSCSGPVSIAASDVRLSSPDGAVFTIGQLQLTVRYLNAGHGVLGAINLPTAPTVGDLPQFASSLFYLASLTTPMSFSTADLAGTSQISIRATAIVQNTTAAAHSATLRIDVLSNPAGCV